MPTGRAARSARSCSTSTRGPSSASRAAGRTSRSSRLAREAARTADSQYVQPPKRDRYVRDVRSTTSALASRGRRRRGLSANDCHVSAWTSTAPARTCGRSPVLLLCQCLDVVGDESCGAGVDGLPRLIADGDGGLERSRSLAAPGELPAQVGVVVGDQTPVERAVI